MFTFQKSGQKVANKKQTKNNFQFNSTMRRPFIGRHFGFLETFLSYFMFKQVSSEENIHNFGALWLFFPAEKTVICFENQWMKKENELFVHMYCVYWVIAKKKCFCIVTLCKKFCHTVHVLYMFIYQTRVFFHMLQRRTKDTNNVIYLCVSKSSE